MTFPSLSLNSCLVPSPAVGNSTEQNMAEENIHLFPNLRTCPNFGMNKKNVTTSKQIFPHVCARFVSHGQGSRFLLTTRKKNILEMSFQWDISEFQNLLEGEVTFVYSNSSRNRTKDVALFPWVKILCLESLRFFPPNFAPLFLWGKNQLLVWI